MANELSLLPFYLMGSGLRTEFGTILPPSGKVVAYVRSTGPQNGDDQVIVSMLLPTIASALARCRSGMGDTIIVLPGHVETVSSANYFTGLVAGTKIYGYGGPSTRPKLTWSTATSTILLNVADVVIDNFNFEMAGDPLLTAALSVAAPITISAAGVCLSNINGRTSVDADQLATIPITTTDAADDLQLINVQLFGAVAGESTTFLQLLGADRLRMLGCHFEGATSNAAVGVMRLAATAAVDIQVRNCSFINRKASSSQAVTGVAASAGKVSDCDFGVLNDSGLIGWGTKGDLMFFRCQVVNLAGETGGIMSTVST